MLLSADKTLSKRIDNLYFTTKWELIIQRYTAKYTMRLQYKIYLEQQTKIFWTNKVANVHWDISGIYTTVRYITITPYI